jgi:hypothetical protein
MDRRLVVNADGAGLDAARDAAILEAVDRGVVRSVSLVANGPTTQAFAAEAKKRPALGVGLHVNLTDGEPLAGRAFTLTDGRGRLLGDRRGVWRRAVDGHVDPQEVQREVEAQWRRLASFGVEIDHVDGRDHVHVLPGAHDGVFLALETLGASVHVRIPAEGDPPPDASPVREPSVPLGTVVLSKRRVDQARAGHGGLASLGAHADVARGSVRPPLWTADDFAGIAFASDPGAFLFGAALKVPGRVLEMMVFTGAVPLAAGAPDPRRAREQAILLAPETARAVSAAGFTLSSFRDARVRSQSNP